MIRHVSRHQALPELAVVRDMVVEKLVQDDVFAQGAVHTEQFKVKRKITVRGTACPFMSHWPDGDLLDFHLDLIGVEIHLFLEFAF